MIVAPVAHVTLVEADSLDGSTRGAGGFGHTGR
jgi:dUTPase